MKCYIYILLGVISSILFTACSKDTIEPEVISVTSVSLNKNVLYLEEGQSELLEAILMPANATNKKVTWISSNPNLVIVDTNGKVTGLKRGNVTILVVTEDESKIAACTVICSGGEETEVPVESLTLNNNYLSLEAGESKTLLATILPENATNKKIVWTSSNTSIATVDANGSVMALKAGDVSIIATSEDRGKVAVCSVSVRSSGEPSANVRTVLVYLAANNSLSSFAFTDLEEMKTGVAKMNTSGMHLLVYIDTGGASRLVELVKKNGTVTEEVVKTYASRNSVGTTETIEVFNDVFSNKKYKAESYGLVYWSHGDGWIPNPLPTSRWVGQDTGDGTHYMNIEDLVEIMKTAPHFDFVLFDACFMQSVEVAYALRNYTSYYLGSPTEIPGPGARYDVLVPAMFAEGDVALNAAKAYFTPYDEAYNDGKGITNSNWTGGASIGIIKTSELEKLANATQKALSKTLISAALRSQVFNYDKRYSSNVGYYDMVQMMRLLTDNAGFATWKNAFDATVPYWATTAMNYSAFAGMFSMEGTNGVSHYIPVSYSTAASAAYRSTEWYAAAGLSKLGW